jgi:hypothetical protein
MVTLIDLPCEIITEIIFQALGDEVGTNRLPVTRSLGWIDAVQPRYAYPTDDIYNHYEMKACEAAHVQLEIFLDSEWKTRLW